MKIIHLLRVFLNDKKNKILEEIFEGILRFLVHELRMKFLMIVSPGAKPHVFDRWVGTSLGVPDWNQRLDVI